MGDLNVGSGSSTTVIGPPPPPPKEEEVQKKQAEAQPKPATPSVKLPDLKKLTSEVKSLGLKLSADFLDEKGNIRADKAAEAKKAIADEAAKRKAKDPGAAARLYQKALSLDPQDKSLRIETAKTWKTWADSQPKPEVKLATLQTALETLKPVGDAEQSALFIDYSKEFAGLSVQAKQGKEGRIQMAKAALVASKEQLDSLHAFLAQPENSDLLLENEHPWMFLGDTLASVGKFDEACFAYNRGVNAAHRDKNFPLRDEFNNKWGLAHEEKYPLTLDFVDPLSGEVANPVAHGLYQALKAQGVTSHSMDITSADNKITAGEVYRYISDNLDDPKVQAVLNAAQIQIPEEDKKHVKISGLGVYLADKYSREAERLNKENATENAPVVAKLLTFAANLDPENPKRSEALGDFYAEQKAYPLAMQAYAEARQAYQALPPPTANVRAMEGHQQMLDEAEKRLKGKIDQAFDKGVKAGSEAFNTAFAQAKPGDDPAALRKTQLQMLQGVQGMYDLYAQQYPEEMKSPKRLREMGELYDSIGQQLKGLGKKEEAKAFFSKAVEQYQHAINANKNDAAFCIQTYKMMGAANDDMGEYKAALIAYSKASMCMKLRINYSPSSGKQLPSLNSIKQDRAPGQYVDGAALGNYLHSDVHSIERIDGLDTLPEWAEGPRQNYIDKLKARIDEGAEAREALKKQDPPDMGKIFESLDEEAKLLTFFGRDDAAAKIGAEAAEIKTKLDNERLGKEVEVLSQSGLLDQKGLDVIAKRADSIAALKDFVGIKGEAFQFGDYLKFETAQGKSKVVFTPAFEALDTGTKNRVLAVLIQSGQRNQISRNVEAAKGPAKLFYEGQLAVFDEDRALAKTKLEQFTQQAKGTQDPKLAQMLQQADGVLQILTNDGKQKPEDVLKDMRTLLVPLAMTLKPGQDGGLDLSAISKDEVKSFDDFRKYLADQVSVDGVQFNAVLFASYEKVLKDPKHEALLKHLYAEFNPSAAGEAPKMSLEEMQGALRSFQRDIIDVKPNRFVSTQINTAKGREALRQLLQDPTFDKGLKAKLCEEIVEVGTAQNYTPPHIASLFEKNVNGYGFYFQDDKLDLGVKYAERVLGNADHRDTARSAQVDKYANYPHEVQRLDSDKLNHGVTPASIQEIAKMVQAQGNKSDGVSLMKAKLGNLYLTVVDNDNWTVYKASDRFKSHVSDKQRAEMANTLKSLLAEADKIGSDAEFAAWNGRVRRFLRGQGDGKSDDFAATTEKYLGKGVADLVADGAEKVTWAVSDTPDDAFKGMEPSVSHPYQDLLRFVDEVHVSDLHGTKVEVMAPDVAVTDPDQKEKAQALIQDLRGMKRGFWYNYQQRNFLSRELSKKGEIVGVGDIASIKAANAEIDGIIADLQKATTPQDFEKIKARLTAATKGGGAIHTGFKDSEMDGTEQMINLVQTVAEIVIITAATRGLATEAALGRAAVTLGQTAVRTRNLRLAYQAFTEVRTAANAAKAMEALEAANMARYGSLYSEMVALEARGALTFTAAENAAARGLAKTLAKGEAKDIALGGVVHGHRSMGARLANAMGGEVGWGVKAYKGFQMGATISLTENVVASLSGQLKAEPNTLLDWLKDATATGLSMVVSAGLNPTLSQQVNEGVVKSLFQRYVANGAKGALHFLGDTGLEVVEEVVDNYVRKKLDGDFSKLSWDELRDITIVCLAGGVKQGVTAHFVNFTKSKVAESQAKKYHEGFSERGERIVQDPKLGYVLVDSEGGFIKKADKIGLQSFLVFDAETHGPAAKGVEIMQFDSTKKGEKGQAVIPGLETFPQIETDKPSADQVKAEQAKKTEEAQQKSVEKIRNDNAKKLFLGFLEKGQEVREVQRKDGVVVGLALVDSKGTKLRDATKDELETFQTYQKLTEGFATRGEKIVGSPSKGYQLVDSKGQTLRQATASELTLYLKHKKKTALEAKVAADEQVRLEAEGKAKADAEAKALTESKADQAKKWTAAFEQGVTIEKVTRGAGGQEVTIGFRVQGAKGEVAGLFLKEKDGSLWGTQEQFEAFQKHQTAKKKEAEAETKVKSRVEAKAAQESKARQKVEWRAAYEQGVTVKPVYRKGHILLGYKVEGVSEKKSGLFMKDEQGEQWATKDQFAAYQKYRVDMKAKEDAKAAVIEMGAKMDAEKPANDNASPEIRMAARAAAVDVLYDPNAVVPKEKLSKAVESVVSVVEALDPVLKQLAPTEKNQFQEQIIRQVQDGSLDVATAKKMAERVSKGENPRDVLMGEAPQSVSAISLVDEVSGDKTPVESIPPPPPQAKGEKLKPKELLGFTTDREVTAATKSAIEKWIAQSSDSPKTQTEIDALLGDLRRGAEGKADGKILVITDGYVHIETIGQVKERMGWAMKAFSALKAEGKVLPDFAKRAVLERALRQAGKSEADIDVDVRYAVEQGNQFAAELKGLPKPVARNLAERYLRGDITLYSARQSVKQYQELSGRAQALGITDFDQRMQTRVEAWYPEAKTNPSLAMEKSLDTLGSILQVMEPMLEVMEPAARKAMAEKIIDGHMTVDQAMDHVVEKTLGAALDGMSPKEVEAAVRKFLKTALGSRYTAATEATYNNYFKAYGPRKVMADALSAMAFDYRITTYEFIKLGQSLEGLDSKAQIALLGNLMAQVKSIDGNATTDTSSRNLSSARVAVNSLVADTTQLAKQLKDLDAAGQEKLLQELSEGKYTLAGALLQADRIGTASKRGDKSSDPDKTHVSGSKMGPTPPAGMDVDATNPGVPAAKLKAKSEEQVVNGDATNPGVPAAKLKAKESRAEVDSDATKPGVVLPFPKQAVPADPHIEAASALADPGKSGIRSQLEGAAGDAAKIAGIVQPFEAVAKVIEGEHKDSAEALRRDVATLKSAEPTSPEYQQALTRLHALQTLLRAEGNTELDAAKLAKAVESSRAKPDLETEGAPTLRAPAGYPAGLGLLTGAIALFSPELAHAAEGAAQDIASRGGIGPTEAAVLVGIGLLVGGPTLLKKYLKKGPPTPLKVTKQNPIKLESEAKKGMLYPYSKADMKNAEVNWPGHFNLQDSMLLGDRVYLALDASRPGDKTTQAVLPMSVEDAKRLGVEFDKAGQISKVPPGDFIYVEGFKHVPGRELVQAADAMEVSLASPTQAVSAKDADGNVSNLRPLNVMESGEGAPGSVSYGKAVAVEVGRKAEDPVRVTVEIYDPADPEADPKVLGFGFGNPKALESRTFDMSRAEAIQLGILRVDKPGEAPVATSNAVLVLNDEEANLHRNNRVYIPTSNEGGLTFYPAKAMGKSERLVGDIVKVDTDLTSRQGDTVYVWLRVPDAASANGTGKLFQPDPIPMSLADARKLGIYLGHDGKLKIRSNEFVITGVTKGQGDQVLVGGKPFLGEEDAGVSVMFRLGKDGQIEMETREKPVAPKAELVTPSVATGGKRIPDALKVAGPLAVGLVTMLPDTAHAATEISAAAASGGWMAAVGAGLSLLVGMAWWNSGGKGDTPNHPPMVTRSGMTRFEFYVGKDGKPTIIPGLGLEPAMTFQRGPGGQWYAHEGRAPDNTAQGAQGNWQPISDGTLIKLHNPYTGEAYVIPFQAPQEAWIPGYAPPVAADGPAQPAVSGTLPTGKLTAIHPYIDDRPFVIGRGQGDLQYSDSTVSGQHVTIHRDIDSGQYYLINGKPGDPKKSTNGILINGVPMQDKVIPIHDGQYFALKGADGKLAYFQFADPKIPAGRVSTSGYVVLGGESFKVQKAPPPTQVLVGTNYFAEVTYGSSIPGDPAGSITLVVSTRFGLDPAQPAKSQAIVVTAQQARQLGLTFGRDGRPLKPVSLQLTPGVETAALPQAARAVVAEPLPPTPPSAPHLRVVPPIVEVKFGEQSFGLEPHLKSHALQPGTELGYFMRLTPHPQGGLFVAEIGYGQPSQTPKKMVVNLSVAQLKSLGVDFDAQGKPVAPKDWLKVRPGEVSAPAPVQAKPVDLSKVQMILDDHVPGKPRKGEVEVGPTEFYGTAAGQTHEGIGRKKLGPDPVNEDALVQGSDWALVLDGMGGMGHGDKASSIPGEAISRYLEAHRHDPDQAKVMADAFQQGYQELWNSPLYAGLREDARKKGIPEDKIKWPGTVAVAHKVVPDGKGGYNAVIVHVGDAGAVVVDKDGKIKYRTEDQGFAQMLVGMEAKSEGTDPTSPDNEKKKRFHPQGNIVTGGIGGKTPPQPVVKVVPLQPGDRIVMFSDGVGDNMSTTDVIDKALDAKSAKEAQQDIMNSTLEKLADLDDAIAELQPGKRLPITLEDGTTAYVAKGGAIYPTMDSQEQIDYYKPDNVTVHVYEHNPIGADEKGPPPGNKPSTPPPSGPHLVPQPPSIPASPVGRVQNSASRPYVGIKQPAVARLSSNSPGVVRVNGAWNVEVSNLGHFPFSYEIGRETFNDGVEHTSVSGKHFRVFRSTPNGPVWIQDLGSTNGTRVLRNGQVIYDAKSADKQPGGLTPVRPGDEIHVGDVVLKVA